MKFPETNLKVGVPKKVDAFARKGESKHEAEGFDRPHPANGSTALNV